MKKILVLIIVIIILLMIGFTVIKFWPKVEEPKDKIINKINEYGYVLEEGKTDLHQQYFEQLVELLSNNDIDEEIYAELIVKLFISDFYNLDNKITKNDIGGIQYIHSKAKDNMILKAKDTIYKYIENNIDNTRTERLPIVSNVEIVGTQLIVFKYDDKMDTKAYKIKAKWTYEEDLEYQTEADITIIHEDKKLSIAELK